MDYTVILGRPRKRRAASPGHPAGVWVDMFTNPDVRISLAAWAHFIAATGLQETAPNVFSDGTTDYSLERRSDSRA